MAHMGQNLASSCLFCKQGFHETWATWLHSLIHTLLFVQQWQSGVFETETVCRPQSLKYFVLSFTENIH